MFFAAKTISKDQQTLESTKINIASIVIAGFVAFTSRSSL
ncbi:hypothetical protein AALB_3124 [Agarivorans albus MKT 106]|uniref:Uncharacterized protein n=1 Tax=Agarivorans albus MKT 106 TaxID=1331007 RepID=R9PNW4_AGAAL|nr:hypothetical protein AALB_3124 [Agarivorans albus MKT 106]